MNGGVVTDGRTGLGKRAEALAAEHLERAGLRIIARNWRRPEGELDLVAVDAEGTCVFCEVRARTGESTGDPLEAIGPRKQRQVARVARVYLATDPAPAFTGYRFDVVAVTFFEDAVRTPRIVHIPGAFETTP